MLFEMREPRITGVIVYVTANELGNEVKVLGIWFRMCQT